MSKYVDVEPLIQYAHEQVTGVFAYPQGTRKEYEQAERKAWISVRDYLVNAQEADVAEVRHGQWLTKEYMYGDPDVGLEDMWVDRSAQQSDYYAYCSICDKAAGYNGEGSLILSDYCPHCGAKMNK